MMHGTFRAVVAVLLLGGLLTPLDTVAVASDKDAVSPQPAEVSELWTGSLYSSSYRAGVCFAADGKVRGVLHLRLSGGKVDVYHFYGHSRDGQIEVRHSSGHVFKGRLASSDAVEGMVRLKNGMKIRMEGKRTHNAPLAPANCAPLAE
ncbi:MAG: hypothetical protein Q4F27_05985 [Desulfovibrionaceae bacterium]|nr:hypothetical protein [Desulfovibrionaceae bacterium]